MVNATVQRTQTAVRRWAGPIASSYFSFADPLPLPHPALLWAPGAKRENERFSSCFNRT